MKKCRYFQSESYRIEGTGKPGSTLDVVKEWCTHPASPKPGKQLIGELLCRGEETKCPIPLIVVTRGSKVLTPWLYGRPEDTPE